MAKSRNLVLVWLQNSVFCNSALPQIKEEGNGALVPLSLSSTHYLPFFPKSFPTVSNPLPLSFSEGRQRQHPQSRRDRDVGDGGQTRAPNDRRTEQANQPASQTAQTFIISFPSIVELEGELEETRKERDIVVTCKKKSVNSRAGLGCVSF